MSPKRLLRLQRLSKSDATIKGMGWMTLAMGSAALFYAVCYLGPQSLVRNSTMQQINQQSSVVRFVESLGPIWPFLFGVSGVSLILSALVLRRVIVACSLAVSVWVFYGAAILIGAVATEPPAPILSGGAAIFISLTHVGLSRAWAGEGVR